MRFSFIAKLYGSVRPHIAVGRVVITPGRLEPIQHTTASLLRRGVTVACDAHNVMVMGSTPIFARFVAKAVGQ